jgi:TolB protein
LGNNAGPIALSDVYLVNADGSGLLQLTSTGDVAGYLSQSWSPDGTRVVFAAKRDDNFDIFEADVDNGSQVRVAGNEGNDLFPAWSPDGGWIAFQSEREGEMDIYVMRPDGTDVRRLTSDALVDQVPNWSPDSRLLSFLTWNENWEGNEVRVSDVDGCGLESPTRNFTRMVGNPVWSPESGE